MTHTLSTFSYRVPRNRQLQAKSIYVSDFDNTTSQVKQGVLAFF